MSIIWGKLQLANKKIITTSKEKISTIFSHIKADSEGNWEDERCQLICLLKKSTPEAENEELPFYHFSSQLVITADCRIDNRAELMRFFRITDQTITDSTLILKAYQRWEDKCVDHLIGAFVFAIWDKKKQKLFCARDQIGIRPFYYTFNAKFCAFSSEKKGLLAIPEFDDTINQDYIINQLTFVGQKETPTFYKNIFRLLPAHTLTITNDQLEIKKYWELPIKETRFKRQEEYVEAFREKFDEAVKCRIRSDREVGAELSGGLDSSGVTAIAQKLLLTQNKSIHAYALLIPEEHRGKTAPYDDNKSRIEEVCQKSKITNYHVLTSMTHRSFTEWLDLRLKIFDGLDNYNSFGGVSSIKEFAQSQNVGVILSGFPGDELVTSYAKKGYLEYLERHDWYNFFKMGLSIYKEGRPPIGLKKTLLEFAYFYLHKISPSFAYNVVKKIQKHGIDSNWEKIREVGFFLKDKKILKKNQNRVTFPPQKQLSFKELQRNHVIRPHTSFRIEAANIRANFFGQETRYPMSDIRLLEYMLSIPIEQKRNKEHGRLMYRRGMQGILPDSVVWRKEEGGAGTMPFHTVDLLTFQPQAHAYFQELKKSNDKRLDIFDLEKMEKAYDDYVKVNRRELDINKYTGMNRLDYVFILLKFLEHNLKNNVYLYH